MIAGVSFRRFYFRLYRGTIRTPQVIEVLKALLATFGQELLIIWDRRRAHRSRLARENVDAQRDAIGLEYLAANAQKINPAESIWEYFKLHAYPITVPAISSDSAHRARRHLRSMQRRSTLVCAFWR